MKVVKAWEEKGTVIPEPYKREIKVLFAPDKQQVKELTYLHAIFYPGSRSDYHVHDRPELITVVTGRGIALAGKIEIPIEPDMALWVEKGEEHQIINTGSETMKLANVFIPAMTVAETIEPRLEAAKKTEKKV